MPVFFNGRLLVSPVTASVVDDSALYNRGLSVGNILALIGRSEGGEPNKALRFGSPSEARAVLRSGELMDAVVKAFDPSAETGAPATVVAVRVNPATQAALTLKDGSADDAIELVSTDYGLYTNQIKVKVEAAATRGRKLTTQLGNDYFSQDNVYRDALQIRYTGSETTGVIDVTGTSVVLKAPSSTTVATIDLNAYPTIQQLVDRINAEADWTATVLDSNGSKPALNGLDYLSGQDVKTANYTVTANLQACVDWFNSAAEGFLTATRAEDAGAAPATLAFTYLSGGSDGSVTNSEWAAAYTVLQGEDVQWVVPLSSDAAIHAMNDAHCAYMSTVARMERRGIVGTATGTSDADAITAAKSLNSDRTSLIHIGYYDFDSNGALALQAPYKMAALVAAMASGSNPGTPLTNKSMKVRGLERKLRNPTDTDALIQGGVLCVEETNRGYRVVQSITTWLNDDNYNKVEMSVGMAIDFTARNVRDALDPLRGSKMTPALLGQAVSRTETALMELARPEPSGPGVLAGDAENPPFKNIRAQIDGDVLRVEAQISPVLPNNYILVTLYAVPYSGSASL